MNRRNIWLIALSLLLTVAILFNLSGCGTASAAEATDLMKGVEAQDVDGKPFDDAFGQSQMELALKLFKSSATTTKNKNTLISPLSVQLALAMTANGANGETLKEMEALLGNGMPIDELNRYLKSYVDGLPSTQKAKLQVANSIWFRDDENRLKVEKNFLQTNANYYGADAFKAPFDGSTLKEINSWVKDNTDGMIDKILDEIDDAAVMYLINAITFDAEWQTVYSKNSVNDGDFTNINGKKKTVTMMHSEEGQYISDGKATGFLKAYKGGKYSFAALLPNEGVDLYDYIESLDAKTLKSTLSNSKFVEVVATMPKFSYDYELRMNNILGEHGMVKAFDSKNADFKKLGRSSNGNIYVGDVLHKTFISVDELGTKAGAVTKVEMRDECAIFDRKVVTLDRPFVYMIIDNETNLPIFMGTVTDID